MDEACEIGEPRGEVEPCDSEDIVLQSSELETFSALPPSGGKVVNSILGRISAAAGAAIDVDKDTYKVNVKSECLESKRRALKYLRLTQRAKQGWVHLSEEEEKDADVFILEVPETSQQWVGGRNNQTLQNVGEETSTVIFFIDEGREPEVEALVATSMPSRPSVPWIKEGRKVEVRVKGDIRNGDNWQIGLVQVLHRSGNIGVKLESSGLDFTTDSDSTRPWYEYGDAVEVRDGDEQWKEASFQERTEDGKAMVSFSEDEGGAPVPFDPADVRPLFKASEEPAGDASEAQGEDDVKEEEAKEEEAAEEKAPEEEKEKLVRVAIFGKKEGHADACVRFMGLIEQKRPGYFGMGEECTVEVTSLSWPDSSDSWGTELYELTEDTKGLCIGAKGIMRKRLKSSSGCAIEYLGNSACLCGPHSRRAACKAMLETLVSTVQGSVETLPEAAQEYCDIVEIPSDIVPFVMGAKRVNISKIEDEESVLTFFAPKPQVEAKENDWNKNWDNWKEQDNGWSKEESQVEASTLSDYAALFASTSSSVLESVLLALEPQDRSRLKAICQQVKDEEVADDSVAAGSSAVEEEKPQETEATGPDTRKVYILASSEHSRKRARFRIETAVEQKWQGFYSDHYDAEAITELRVSEDEQSRLQEDAFGIAVIEMEDDRSIGAAIGKKGQRKAKIMAASGCLIEAIGQKIFFGGTASDRARARQYMQWFLDQQNSSTPDRQVRLSSRELISRSDVTVMMLTEDEKANLPKDTLLTIEQDTSTCIFFREVPECELLTAGARLLIRRGGFKFPVEVESSEQEDKSIKLTLRVCEDDPETVIEEIKSEALMPVLIFAKDGGASGQSGRSLAERRIKEHLQGGSGDWAEEHQQASWDNTSWKQEEDSSKGWKARKGDDNTQKSSSSHAGRDNWNDHGKQDQNKAWESHRDDDKGWKAKEEAGNWKNDKNDWNQSKSNSGGQRSREDNGNWGQSRSNDRNQDNGNWGQSRSNDRGGGKTQDWSQGSKSQDGNNWQQNKSSEWSASGGGNNSRNGGWVAPPPGHENKGSLWGNWKGTGDSHGYKDDQDDWAAGNGRRKW